MLKLWVDDLRPAPQGYEWARSVNEAKDVIRKFFEVKEGKILQMNVYTTFEVWTDKMLLDLDHDMGSAAADGGDCIELISWLEKHQYLGSCWDVANHIEFRLHTMNPVGRENMTRAILQNEWRLVL